MSKRDILNRCAVFENQDRGHVPPMWIIKSQALVNFIYNYDAHDTSHRIGNRISVGDYVAETGVSGKN